MDHFTSSDPPHADVRKAPAQDLLALANFEHEAPLSIADTAHGESWLSYSARSLVASVGSSEALETLDAEPHSLEPLDLTGLEPADCELASRLVELIDRADLRLDDEMTTIVHRLVARLAGHPDRPLQRKAKDVRIAAAIAWLALSGSGMIARRKAPGVHKASFVWEAFGTSSASDLGHTLSYALRHPEGRRAAESKPFDPGSVRLPTVPLPLLDDPALLHSRHRASLIEQRHDLKRRIREERRSCMERHPVQILPSGNARFATSPTTVRWALRSPDENGRSTVMIATGDLDSMTLTSISVTDAHRLIAALECALNEPLASVS